MFEKTIQINKKSLPKVGEELMKGLPGPSNSVKSKLAKVAENRVIKESMLETKTLSLRVN